MATTGETLIKTVLAPMFRARALRVCRQGHTMLGNRDGEVLARSGAQGGKMRTRTMPLRSCWAIRAHTRTGHRLHAFAWAMEGPPLTTALEGFIGAR